jgi:hypothetical protein
MELSNEFIEDLFYQQIKELTIRTNKQLRSFDAQFSGITQTYPKFAELKNFKNFPINVK